MNIPIEMSKDTATETVLAIWTIQARCNLNDYESSLLSNIAMQLWSKAKLKGLIKKKAEEIFKK